jgi:hypothetical protein
MRPNPQTPIPNPQSPSRLTNIDWKNFIISKLNISMF